MLRDRASAPRTVVVWRRTEGGVLPPERLESHSQVGTTSRLRETVQVVAARSTTRRVPLRTATRVITQVSKHVPLLAATGDVANEPRQSEPSAMRGGLHVSFLQNPAGALYPGCTATQKRQRKGGISLAVMEAKHAYVTGDVAAFTDFALNGMVKHAIAESSQSAYAAGWKQWVLFTITRGASPFLSVETRAERLEAEKHLLAFVAMRGFGIGEGSSTVKGKLMSIRYHHLINGHENPLKSLPRVWMGYTALKRSQGPTVRKHPVTPEMTNFLDSNPQSSGVDELRGTAARYVGLFGGLRRSEFLGSSSATFDRDKCLMVEDISPMKGAEYTKWGDPLVDGIMLHIRGSKTDQYNLGCLRYVGKTSTTRCAVKAMLRWHAAEQEHFSRVGSPMFSDAHGSVMSAARMQTLLKCAAVALGMKPERVATHSLRIGMVTWMYQAGFGLETIKRQGRWTSNVVHVYLWEGTGQASSIAERMASVDFVLHAQSQGR